MKDSGVSRHQDVMDLGIASVSRRVQMALQRPLFSMKGTGRKEISREMVACS